MWMVVVFVVALLLAVVMAPRAHAESARASKLGDFQFPRAKHGDPLPLVWGTVRQKGPIIAWYGDYTPIPVTVKQKNGMFSSRNVIVGYKNYMGIDCIVALGPDVRLRRIWADTYEIWKGDTSDGSFGISMSELFGGDMQGGGLSGDFTFYSGAYAQKQDAYLAEKIGPNVPSYNGIARVVFKNFYIGTSTTPKAFSFEISRITHNIHATYSVMPNGLDVNPMEIVYDAICEKWGRFGNTREDLEMESFVNCAKTLYDEKVGMSLAVQASISGKELLEEVMRVADGLLYQDPATGKIVAKLIRKDYNESELMILDQSKIKSLSNFQKTTWESTLNQCRVTFKDRSNNYDDSVAITQDFANINFQQRIKSTEISVPGCTDAEVASILCARQLSLLNVPLYKCDIVTNRTSQKLRPGHTFILNYEPFGISGMVMRVTKINFGTVDSGEISFSCVQDRFATADVTFAKPEHTHWTPINSEAKDISRKAIFNPPAFLSAMTESENVATFDNAGRLYVAALQPSGTSVSFDALMSVNNFASEGELVLDDANYNGGGLLLNDYASTVAIIDRHDTSSSLVLYSVSAATIATLKNYKTFAEANDGSAFLMIGNELFVYVGFVDNGHGQVTFPNIYRSMLDTGPEDHAANSSVYVISKFDGLMSPLVNVGSREYVKLLDSTPTATLSPANASSFDVVVSNRAGLPLPPVYLQLNGTRDPHPMVGGKTLPVSWHNRSREDKQLFAYNDTRDIREAGTQTRLRWRLNNGAFQTVTVAGNAHTIDITGLEGIIEVFVDSVITATGKYSQISDTLKISVSLENYILTEDDNPILTEDDNTIDLE